MTTRTTILCRFLMLALIAGLPLAGSPAAAQSDVVPMLPGTLQVLNGGPDDQILPRVDGTLAAYVDDDGRLRTVRYFDFASGIDAPIDAPGGSHLPDVNGGLVAFTNVALATGSRILVFDPASGSSFAVPGGNQRSFPAIGGNLVAFEDRSFSPFPNESEIVVYDLVADLLVRLTTDALMDVHPAVSPTGNVVTFQKCQTTGLGCEIYTAIQSTPGIFTTRQVTAGPGSKRTPDTNGTLVVYASDQSGEADVYFQPVAGGTETRLAIPGHQRNPSIAGNLVLFESRPSVGNTSSFDLYLYDLAGDRLFRVTDTPGDELLNDVTFSDGVGRIVWSAPGDFGDLDVFAFTFELDDSAAAMINDLVALVESLRLPGGIEASLLAKLRTALAALEASDVPGACAALADFIHQVQAQSGKKLTPESAAELIAEAGRIQAVLGCADGLSEVYGSGDDEQRASRVSEDLVADGQDPLTDEPAFTKAVAGAGASYVVTDLGTLWGPADASRAYGINAGGQVVGWVQGTSQNAAFRWDPTDQQMHNLGLSATAYGINADGQAVGSFTTSAEMHAFRTAPNGTIADGDDLGARTILDCTQSVALDVNASGQVVGWAQGCKSTTGCYSGTNGSAAVVWDGTTATCITGSDASYAYGINASGQIVGSVQAGAVIWQRVDGGGWSQSPPIEKYDTPQAINDYGQVILKSGSNTDVRARLWTPDTANGDSGTLTYLQIEGQTLPYGINTRGQVVGSSGNRAFLWTPDQANGTTGTIVDLNTLLPANSGWTLSDAQEINDAGQIVGSGRHNGASRAFLLTDGTPPVVTATATADFRLYPSGSWTPFDVIVSFECTDDLSGVASTTPPQTVATEGENQSVTGTCTDFAGNVATTSFTGINVDKTAPYVECGTADGQWHADDVSIACRADDGLSGLSDPADAIFALVTKVPDGTETANAQTLTHTVCDLVGHCATAGPVGFNRVDKKAPDVGVTAPLDGASYALGDKVLAEYSCWDGGSAVASCIGTVANGEPVDTASPGTKSFTVTATDNVGNAVSRQVTYTVVDNGPMPFGKAASS